MATRKKQTSGNATTTTTTIRRASAMAGTRSTDPVETKPLDEMRGLGDRLQEYQDLLRGIQVRVIDEGGDAGSGVPAGGGMRGRLP